MSSRVGKSDINKTMDRGPREFKTRVADTEGNVMVVAEKEVVTTSPTKPIKNVAGLMEKHDFRRIPVTNAGTNRLEGMAVAIDILDFLGGGEKYNIIKQDYGGNFLSAINCPISKIMQSEYPYLNKKSSIDEVVDIIVNERSSAIPVVENDDNKKVVAIITERDVLPIADSFSIPVKDSMTEKCLTTTPGMMISDASRLMVKNRIRRIPVISDDEIVGVVTVFDILRFLDYGKFEGINAEEILSKTKVKDVMEEKVVTASPEQDLSEIPKLVKKTGLGGFPVVENGNLIGIVTTSDVIRDVYK